jgi:putative effector of murein hydrolase
MLNQGISRGQGSHSGGRITAFSYTELSGVPSTLSWRLWHVAIVLVFLVNVGIRLMRRRR